MHARTRRHERLAMCLQLLLCSRSLALLHRCFVALLPCACTPTLHHLASPCATMAACQPCLPCSTTYSQRPLYPSYCICSSPYLAQVRWLAGCLLC